MDLRPLYIGFIFTLLFSITSTATAEGTTHLIILSGQSNMARMNPNISFTPTVTEALAQDEVIVVKSARGGQPIHRWYKNWQSPDGEPMEQTGGLYDEMMQKVIAALADRKPDTVTFIWMQGERDAKMGWGEVYADAMRGLIEQLAADLGRDDLNFVIGRLSDHGSDKKKFRRGWDQVRTAQVQVAQASQRGAWVDTDDLNDKKDNKQGTRNALHYTKAGYKELGRRFAEEAVKLIKAASNQ